MQQVLVIGGGIIGLLTAYFLREQGHGVIIVDKEGSALGGSSAGDGALGGGAPESRRRYAASQNAAGLLYPLDPDHASAQELADLAYSVQWYSALSGSLSPAQQASLCFTQVALRVAGGERQEAPTKEAHTKEAHTIDPRSLLLTLKALLQERGVVFVSGLVSSMSFGDGVVKEVVTCAGAYAPDAVVICAGAWSGSLLPGCAAVVPMRGVVARLGGAPFVLEHPVLYQDGYILQHTPDEVLVGTSRELVLFDGAVGDAVVDGVVDGAVAVMPALSSLTVQDLCWLVFGPTPTIWSVARHPELANCYLHYGHGGHGFCYGPASSARLAALLS